MDSYMKTISLRVPQRGTSFWLDLEEVPPTAATLWQFKGSRYKSGQYCDIEVGSVVLKVSPASFKHSARYIVCILLPEGEWFEARECSPPGCAQLLRDYLRTWLTLSPECRVVRAAEETIGLITKEIELYLDKDEEHTLEDAFVHNRLTKIDSYAEVSAAAAVGDAIIDETTVFDAFQRWLEAMASISELPPDEMYYMLVRGAQRANSPHVDYLRRFNRIIKFQDENTDE